MGEGEGIGDGVAVSLGVGDGLGVGVTIGEGVAVGVTFGAGEVVGIGVAFLNSFQTNFFPDFTHRNSEPDFTITFPTGEQLDPAFTAPFAGSIETKGEAMMMASPNRETRKKKLTLRRAES